MKVEVRRYWIYEAFCIIMKKNNFITICGWMINGLDLKANELIVYAIIYGFSQDGSSKFTGSLKYLQNALKVSRNTVIKTLKVLVEKGLIIKESETNNGVTFNKYYHIDGVVQLLMGGSSNIALGGSSNIAPNITNNNNTNNNIDFKGLLDFINSKTGRDFKVINSSIKNKFKTRLKEGYDKKNIINAVINASKVKSHVENGCQYLTPEFFSRQSTLDKYGVETSNTKKELKEKVDFKEARKKDVHFNF